MNMLGVSWGVIQDFRALVKRLPIDLAAAATYRHPPISNVAPDDPTWHTKDVCEQLIKPITGRCCPYSELLAAQDPTSVAPANVFVSHAWEYNFEQACSTLEMFFVSDHARDNGLTRENTFFWFDIFTLRQRNREEDRADPKPCGWWRTTFLLAIKVCPHDKNISLVRSIT